MKYQLCFESRKKSYPLIYKWNGWPRIIFLFSLVIPGEWFLKLAFVCTFWSDFISYYFYFYYYYFYYYFLSFSLLKFVCSVPIYRNFAFHHLPVLPWKTFMDTHQVECSVSTYQYCHGYVHFKGTAKICIFSFRVTSIYIYSVFM